MRSLMALVVLLILSFSVQAADPVTVPAGPGFDPGGFQGRIVGFTKSGVIIKPEGRYKVTSSFTLPDGTTVNVVYVQDNTQPPREFVFEDCLFPDRPGSKTARVGEHNVTDLRNGDIVNIGYSGPAQGGACVCIQIRRRPGGRVPPAIWDSKFDECNRVCTRCNAEQFIEEKVVPVTLPRLLRNIHR